MTNVLIVISGLNKGGTEYFVYNYLKELVKLNIFKFDIYSYSSNDEDMVNKFKDFGCNIYYGIAPSVKNLFKAKRCFKHFLKDKNYDTIHCNCNLDNALFLKIARKTKIANRLNHLHDATPYNQHLFGRIRTHIKRNICLSNSTLSLGCSVEALITHIKTTKGVIVSNIIDINKFINSRNKNNLKKEYVLDDCVILSNISLASKNKNQEFCINLFNRYHNINSNSKLILGGPGNFDEYIKLIDNLKLRNDVLFIGPRDDIEKWYAISDYYLMPSLHEGFGLAAVEAQYAGAYVLASTNVPKTTDYGAVSYLSLNNMDEWLNKLQNKPKTNLKKYDISKDIEIMKNIYLGK